MKRFLFLLLGILILFFTSCDFFMNQLPVIKVSYGGTDLSSGAVLEISRNTSIVITIRVLETGGINDVSVNDATIMNTDTEPSEQIFEAAYNCSSPVSPLEDAILIIRAVDNWGAALSFQLTLRIPSSKSQVLLPEIAALEGGGFIRALNNDDVYYFTDSSEDSDIRMNPGAVYFENEVRYYIELSGTAVPNDYLELGGTPTDRAYHHVLFMAQLLDGSGNPVSGKSYYNHLPVDVDNKFQGYLYLPEAGEYEVYSFRYPDDYLYPKATVAEWSSTLLFYVQNLEAIPADLHHLFPTRGVDVGTKHLRDTAAGLVEGIQDPYEQIKTIYEYLVDTAEFTYSFYDEEPLYPGYLSSGWNDIFLASDFLIENAGVCNDFAQCFAAMTRSLGFDVQLISGTDAEGFGHMWNRIEVPSGYESCDEDGDGWFLIDATWGNSTGQPRRWAEFYADFNDTDLVYFKAEHDDTFVIGFTIEY